MSEYIPDAWVVLEITPTGADPEQKVLAGWSGGYIDGDSWRLSSGIASTEETDTEWIFTNYIGSIYHCRKSAREFNMVSSGVYREYRELVDGTEDLTIRLIEFTRD